VTALWIVVDLNNDYRYFDLVRIAWDEIVRVQRTESLGIGEFSVTLSSGCNLQLPTCIDAYTSTRLEDVGGMWVQPRLLLEDLIGGPGADIDVTWETTDGDTWTRRENYRPTGRPVRK